MTDTKPPPPPADIKAFKIFASQPQLMFRIAPGPHHIEEEDGIVFLVQTRTGRPVLFMPASIAPAFGYTPETPEPPRSGTRLSKKNRKR